ncbi:hypothetical protein Hanom_Chr08g00684441 [Helianthus anomalus]
MSQITKKKKKKKKNPKIPTQNLIQIIKNLEIHHKDYSKIQKIGNKAKPF